MYKKIIISALTALSTVFYSTSAFSETLINHSEKHFNGFDNTRLFEQSWIPAQKPKAVLIIMHGLKDHSTRYNNFAEKLVSSNYAVYAFDLRGHGKSKGEKSYVNSFEDYIEDLDIFVKNVQEREKGSPVFLFGHSMGGAIVTKYIMEKKPDIKGFILSAPAIKEGKDISLGLISVIGKIAGILPHLALLDLNDNLFSRDPNVVEKNIADPLIYHKNGPARTASELLNNLKYIQDNSAEITQPFLVMHGTADKITNPEGSELFYEKASSKDKTIKSYDGLYHDLLNEPEKDKVIENIVSWLDSHI